MKPAFARSAGFRVVLAGLAVCLIMLAVTACTLIHIEGNSNCVSEVGGHTATVAVPASSPGIPDMPLAR